MFDPQSHNILKERIFECIKDDKCLLDELRGEIRPLKNQVKRIQPRTTTSISLVGTDGGNNKVQFNPFLIQIIRVVDSSNNEYCLEAITPSTDVAWLSSKQFNSDGSPNTALGELMVYLGINSLTNLSTMINENKPGHPISSSWVQVYRELVEWAILFTIIRNKSFASDTLIVCDGLLRSKVFSQDFFKRYLKGIEEGINNQWNNSKRQIYLAGVAKHSKVLERYRLVMALEGILNNPWPAFVEVPRDIEEKAYIWSEYARGDDRELENTEINKFVGGKMFLVKFGSDTRSHVWPVDIFLPQREKAQSVIGYLLADAINGFPVPLYPQCLQKAHENAALVDFDFDILQDQIFEGIRNLLGSESRTLDVFRLQDSDPSQKRYS